MRAWGEVLVSLCRFPWFVLNSLIWWLAWWIRYRGLRRLAEDLRKMTDAIEGLLERIHTATEEAERITREAERECSRTAP